MHVIFYVIIGGLVFIGFISVWHRIWPVLFGAWYCTGWFGEMPFWTLAGAKRYRDGRTIDPYCRGLQGPIEFRPGRLLRREKSS